MNENSHPINDLMQTTMAKIREMVDANRVVEMVPEMFDKITGYLDKKDQDKSDF